MSTPESVSLKSSSIKIGIVPTHLKFVGGLVPDEQGRLPREEDGSLRVVANLKKLREMSPVKMEAIQIPYFQGAHAGDVKELVQGLNDQGLEVHFIMMVGGGDPMNPADEDVIVQLLTEGLTAARKHNIKHVASTSLEAWMGGGAPKTGPDFDAAIEQLVKIHQRAIAEAGVDGTVIEAWHIEFLRSGEFQTFTNLEKVQTFLQAVNSAHGGSFFKALVDAAHCGDSDLSMERNAEIIQQLADADQMELFHASTKTTRGCFSTDDGWIGALLTAAAKTGKLKYVFAEFFHHQDDALAALRELDSRHGVDTTDGRSYDQLVVDGLVEVARRTNNLVARGLLS